MIRCHNIIQDRGAHNFEDNSLECCGGMHLDLPIPTIIAHISNILELEAAVRAGGGGRSRFFGLPVPFLG